MSEAIVSISGMTCGACSSSIIEALNSVAGVSEASVSLITEEAKVIFNPTIISPDSIIQTIEDCGFDARLTRCIPTKATVKAMNTVIEISGMTCGACSASITEALEKLPGVAQASVSVITNSGSVLHSSDVTLDQIVETVEDCGFDAKVISSKSKSDSSTFTTTLSVQGMTCGACLASITEALQKVEGVLSVSVSLITEEALVVHADIDTSILKTCIEDCGFDANIITTRAETVVDEPIDEDEANLQIFGINETTDLASLQYNIEAVLQSLPGINQFYLAFKNAPEITDSNSSDIQAVRSIENQEIYDNENIIDELTVEYDPRKLGIRALVDALNGMDDSILFLVVNSVDQSASSQLRLLSRVKDIQYWRGNFFKSLCLGIPVVILSHLETSKFFKTWMLFTGFYVVTLIELLISSYIQFHLGAVFLKKFSQFVRLGGKNATMDVLVCISTMISYSFSILAVFLSVWSGQTKRPPTVLFDTSAMLVTFISLGKWLENKAKGATSTALSKLLSLTPTSCTIIEDFDKYEKFNSENGEKTTVTDFPTRNISIDLIQTNDIAIVLPGGKVPADGVIVFGESDIDESIITGESLPIYKKVGDSVIGGSINGPNLIHIKVTRSGKRSQLQQIISLVKDSQVSKAPAQRFADYVAARFVPSVLVLALVTFLAWILICYVLHPEHLPKTFTKEENGKFFVCLKLAISVIVVACPCALGLAAPTAIMVGTGIGASNGVLIKGGDVLEKASKINMILFDKTGTLTTGMMKVMNFKPILDDKLSVNDWWNLVGSVEANSEHPVGRAISKQARVELGFKFEEDGFETTISDFKVLTGCGVKARISLSLDNKELYKIFVGNNRMINEMFPHLKATLSKYLKEDLKELVNSLAHVIINDEYSGYLEVTDDIKPHAKEVINNLTKQRGYVVGILTGDSKQAALNVGKELGISSENIFSEVLPMHKEQIICDIRERFSDPLSKTGAHIAFVGDGINDAPALAQADIGLAISSGTDIAIESADIVLIGGNRDTDLLGVSTALEISSLTFRRIKLNFIWATIYNTIMLPFAMGCFLPFNIMLPPIAAGGSMAFSSVSVVLSSLMLRNWKPQTFNPDLEKGGPDLSLKHSTSEDFALVTRRVKVKNSQGYEAL